MKTYKPTIGLEIHAELKTQTKMFCDSKNDADETRPNVNVCPICMGHPGTLPVINKAAVKHVLRVGVALGGELADYSEFDRKNYFYPDIPKGYQISQYKYPLIKGGELAGVKITRVHLEEDTASSAHVVWSYDSVGTADEVSERERNAYGESFLNFNRAGVPLMELVTEPVIHSAEQAGNFARELQLLLRYLGASEANMEKGEMRVEANISIAVDGDTQTSADNTRTDAEKKPKLGTKVEVKNLNSFKAAERAIAYEIKRHTELLERGEKIVQETRGWDENTGKTFSQRKKEDSHDYRYFPDPDLPKLKLSEIDEFSQKALKKGLSELPDEKRTRYAKEFGIKPADIHIY
ncbi:MAG TPA: Asp-tRNA(Asn)/Glu-tRNA(Gln) amidotransferase subunit GatB, partial [Candidatus Paceibacterota bacterium]|nr:Asp-tRNA(Asn)/Glu-tRNA(Gln) amidotransferase subunit GatB [Candidatus Paceibacterota bacterium]